MREYLANEYSILALERIAASKERPLTLISQLPPEQMDEVHLMLRHGILGGQIIQAPPNQPRYLLRVDRINEEGTRLLIEAYPNLKTEIAALADEALAAEASGRRGDPRCELASQELERRKEAKATEEAQRPNQSMNTTEEEQRRQEALGQSKRAQAMAAEARQAGRAAGHLARWSTWMALAALVISIAALWVAWSSSQKAKDDALEQRVLALEKRPNSQGAPFMVLPSQTPAPAVPPGTWTLPNGGTMVNPNGAPATPWVLPSRP